ncbi:related to oxidoreductase, short chain dehydrogenase/reductase family [Melanopsichium pennsylvanicum]|uniref:Related to oxidoreductase, short chain dehydrogenase/reductase family n=2 Tax=Melanopsichium pennsylvanicum TaxID=63383 RepID=A0AAJ5C8Q4_9BASI|nr:short chain dehydrogenase reductase family [Melanopsichium pennsylvanicum 4]SNX87853.1 related to oxidoreductase, short chain dehydrogenase/reductase family [Melanopsichium pennsylvanicum]
MSISAAAKQIVVVVGAGPGLGFSVARKFAEQGHPVALLSRSKDRLESLAAHINGLPSHGRAVAYAVDVQDEASVNNTIQSVQDHFQSGEAGAEHKDAFIHTGIFNPGGGFVRAPFLETKASQVEDAFKTQVYGGFVFSQAILKAITSSPAFTQNSDAKVPRGNILLTGATASVKGSANFSAFASSKFGLRALGQSLAREWGPKGVHVSHFIIDGIIVTDRTDSMLGKDYAAESRMDPDAIAQVYLDTARQPRSVWAFEMDLRPSVEKW